MWKGRLNWCNGWGFLLSLEWRKKVLISCTKMPNNVDNLPAGSL